MIINRFLLSIVSVGWLSLLCGCEQPFNLDKYKDSEIENMLVVNSIINPDSTVAVSVTHPYFFSTPHIAFKPVEDLCVEMTANNGEWEQLGYDDESGLYLSSHKPLSGDRVSLRIADNGTIVTATDDIPEKVEIESVTASVEGPIHIYWDNDYRFTYKISFIDPGNEDNYYFLKIDDDSMPWEYNGFGEIDYTADYVFQVLASIMNQDIQGWQPSGVFGYPFSDKGIDGRHYTLTIHEVMQNPYISTIDKLPRRIKLYSISKAYYDYMVSVLSMDYDEEVLKGNLLSLGLMEPMKIFSNIDGGVGIMGSYNLAVKRVELLELTGGWSLK